MSKVVIKNLVKNFGATRAVDDVSLELSEGEFFSLLGSSGCGKTTTLRCVAGLEVPDSGSIFIDDADISDIPSSERDCGMVFQNYALFPHMTIADNVAYGLMARKYRQAGLLGKVSVLFRSASSLLPNDAMERVREALAMVELSGYEERRPGQLSGGQQQRVALARALVTSPRVLLFDEPLGALDAKLRVKMREEIRRIQKRAGITTLYVTHDQEEALSISDRLAVMNKGKVVQVGAPEELYLKPRNRFIADFIGLTNIYAATAASDGQVQLSGGPVVKTSKALPQGQFAAVVRPEDLSFVDENNRPDNVLRGTVQLRMFMGSSVKYVVKVNDLEFTLAVSHAKSRADIVMGCEAEIGFSSQDLLILEED